MSTVPTIDGASRKAIEQALLAMKRIYQAGYDRIIDAGGSCDAPEYMMAGDPTAIELRALLDAAPVVERQPVAEVVASGGAHREYIGVILADGVILKHGEKLYTAPPEVAELQATIDQLKAESERLSKDLESHKRMLLNAAISMGAIGEAMGAEMDDDASELEGLATELRKDAEFHQQVQRGAGELPRGWEILIRIEKDAGNAELIDPEGNEVDYPSNHECLADSVSDAIDEALSSVKKTGD